MYVCKQVCKKGFRKQFFYIEAGSLESAKSCAEGYPAEKGDEWTVMSLEDWEDQEEQEDLDASIRNNEHIEY